MRWKVHLLLAVAVLFCFSAVLSAQFFKDNTIPGYVHRNGAGSRVDVRTDGIHDGANWTVVFKRNLQTGDLSNDIQFVAGGSYSFQVATWDNSGDAAHNTADMATVFQMDIPATAGPLVFSATPTVLKSLSGELLSSGEIQITAVWADTTKNDSRKQWSFDGSAWSQSSGNEDRMAFIWDMQSDGFASAGTCLTMCHPPVGMYTAPGTKVDTWQWKATRTNPSGYADDKYWDDGQGGTKSGRHGDSGQEPFFENKTGDLPSHMSVNDPGASATFLFELPKGISEAIAWLDGAWNAGDVLPGYVGRRGSGSAVDVRTMATHDGSGWTITFRRKLDTGDAANDIKFEAGGTYSFQVAKWNNAGDELHDTSDMATVFSMTLPADPGAVTFSATPTIFSSLSGEVLSSNEIEITATWADSTRNDTRKQWSFDGATWTQSSDNEDRVAFIWDLQADSFATTGTCMAMCHPPDKMYTAAGKTDTWQWKATRTASTWFTDDKYWDDGAGGTASGRHGDAGTSVFKDNADNGGVPTYMSANGPGTSAQWLFDHPAAAGWSEAVAFDTDGVQPTDPCVANTTTACLLNNRFRVTVRYRSQFDNAPADTDANRKNVTGFANPAFETAFFYFNSEDNIEMLVKMLDQGNTDGSGRPTIAVLTGTATPLRIEITITDTTNGLTKRYTSEFPKQAGSTDFTAFLK